MDTNPIRRKISPESPIWSIHIGYLVAGVLTAAYAIYNYQELPSIGNILSMEVPEAAGVTNKNRNNMNRNNAAANARGANAANGNGGES